MSNHDPYSLQSSNIKEPPTDLGGILKYIGPGFILSASIVGSGELIATTILGAEAGFVLLWFIILSCLVKVAVQLEFGKHAISSGQSTMASLNILPGPRFGKANWSIWTWLALMIPKMIQVAGIVSGVVLALIALVPSLDHPQAHVVTTFVVAASVSLLVYQGYYRVIEKVSLVMIGLFTVFTLASLISLQSTDYAISSGELISGFVPGHLEAGLIVVAIGAFGITGVGGDEIMAYNYWLIEKGYASYTGTRDESEEWARRAKGWVRIMYWDAFAAMIAYTAMTAMFYLLGAAVLHRNGIVPAKSDLIETLGTMYTSALGPWAKTTFLFGAVIVLYSTLLAALAAWSRLFSDAFGRVGLYSFEDQISRRRAIAVFAWAIPMGWAGLSLWFSDPGMMVIIGGVATTVILLIVLFAALFFRYRKLDPRLRPSKFYDFALWLSAVAILCVALIGISKTYHDAVKLFFPEQDQLKQARANVISRMDLDFPFRSTSDGADSSRTGQRQLPPS